MTAKEKAKQNVEVLQKLMDMLQDLEKIGNVAPCFSIPTVAIRYDSDEDTLLMYGETTNKYFADLHLHDTDMYYAEILALSPQDISKALDGSANGTIKKSVNWAYEFVTKHPFSPKNLFETVTHYHEQLIKKTA